MATATVRLRPAGGEDLQYVERLLTANDLPAEDLRDDSRRFFVATDGDSTVGVGGLEQYGTAGLLRSVVVEQSVRGEGYGTALCDALETEARESGIDTLYLLTTTARAFFADRDYEEIERAAAPDAIRETTEFTELCPTSATCMRKQL